MSSHKIIFAIYAESAGQLLNICRLAQSLRAFGGRFNQAPVWAYVPDHITIDDEEIPDQLRDLGIEIRPSHTPGAARWFYYAGKPYAAAAAETAAQDQTDILAWLDEDTIFLSEPGDFNLSPNHSFGYRPVMHNRSGSLYDSPPDAFWGRIYEILSLPDDKLFPMVTPADRQKIRAYFQAGVLIVRPEKGILRRWATDFEILYKDNDLAEMCRQDANKRIFLHQTALVGAALNTVERGEMVDLSERYNYPLFFERQYGAAQPFDSIEDVVTLRLVVSSKNLDPDWPGKVIGPSEKITWLKDHLF